MWKSIQRRLCLCLLLAAPLAAPAQEMPGDVRVRLFDEAPPQALVVSAEESGLRFFAGDGSDNLLTELGPRQQATIRTRGDELYVQTDDLAFFALSLRMVPKNDGLLKVQVAEGNAAPHRYAGSLSLAVDRDRPPALRLVHHVALEAYVAAVVAREYGANDLEGAKAMAVAARTYALHRLARGDDLTDGVLAQRYDGNDAVTRTAREAARQTQGEVLTYRGEFIEAVYSASSGGHTADNESVWQADPLPYLRGVSDPYDAASPHAAWQSTVPRGRLLRMLSDAYGFTVEGFFLGKHSRDGRVATIELLRADRRVHRIIRSNDFRLLVNRHFGEATLKSTLFDARRDGDRYEFTGRGHGHGVGLSQYGALEMAQQGHTYRDILAFYYTDARLEQRDAAPAPAWATTAPAPKPPPERRQPANTKTRRVGW